MATIGKQMSTTEPLPGRKRIKNPVTTETTAARGPRHPISPIKAQTTAAGEPYTIVCVQQDDGRYVAEIVEAPEIRFVGKTRAQAERVVSKIYTDTRGPQEPHDEVEDRLWLELARANRETQGVTPNRYRRQRGQS